MTRIARRLSVPLDVGFMDDDKVIQAGEQAAWLYLAILLKCKVLASDGVITKGQISRLAVPQWQRRLACLQDAGLVRSVDGNGTYAVPSWGKWNELQDQRATRLKADRDRKGRPEGDLEDGQQPR